MLTCEIVWALAVLALAVNNALLVQYCSEPDDVSKKNKKINAEGCAGGERCADCREPCGDTCECNRPEERSDAFCRAVLEKQQ
jgi:hypothetical protein